MQMTFADVHECAVILEKMSANQQGEMDLISFGNNWKNKTEQV